jgi:hypothetical protein
VKKQSTQSLLKKLYGDLDWPILECPTEMDMVRVISDHKNKSHYRYQPERAANKSSDLDQLHELGHATLCERVHPIFATNSQFPLYASKKQFLQLLPALSTATDWYVCHWQSEILPEEMRQVIRQSLPVVEEILAKPELPPIEIILDAALIIAQAVHYLDEELECGGPLKEIVDAFLSVAPESPSKEGLVQLINKVMAAYSEQRARLVPEGEHLVWELYLPPGATGDPEPAGAAAAL